MKIKCGGASKFHISTKLSETNPFRVQISKIKAIHKKNIYSVFSPARRINWSKVLFAGGVWAGLAILFELVAYFMKPDSLFFSQYPLAGEYRTHWNRQPWKQGPFDDNFQEYLHFALSIGSPENEHKIYFRENWLGRIRSMLARGTCLYAFNYKESPPDSYPTNVDFYIISPREKILIIINHNM